MKDDEVRKVADNVRDYFRETAESIRIFRWVWRELTNKESKRWSRRLLVLSLLGTVVAMAQPWFTKSLLDGAVQKNRGTIIYGLIGFGICLLFAKVLDLLASVCRERTWGENFVNLDRRLSGLFFSQSLGQHLRESGSLNCAGLSKGRDHIFNVQGVLLFNNGLVDMLQMFVSLAALWLISPVVGGIALGMLVHYVAWLMFLNRAFAEKFAPVEVNYRRYTRALHELWDKVERVKTCGRAETETRRLADFGRATADEDRRHSLWFDRLATVRSLITDAAFAAIMAYGAWSVLQGEWTVGLLYPVFSWTAQFRGDLWRIGQIERQLNKALPAVKALRDVLSERPDVTDRQGAASLPTLSVPRVEFVGVSHTYPPAAWDEDDPETLAKAGQPVLGDISFAIAPGEKVALIGPSGVGKTTLMRLFQRYADPDKGVILVDGRDLRDWRLDSWIGALGYIAQQPQVMDGTIRSNLVFGLSAEERARVTDENLWTVMRRLKIDFGSRLTQGLETKVGRNGIKLSGGEAQRLMIGAAAVRKPRVMVIDEATSSLDSTTEKEVQAGLAEVLSDGVSALVIAHRLSTVRDLCDRFLVLANPDDGNGARVEATASSFEELYRLSPTFRRLADDQGLRIGSDKPPDGSPDEPKGEPAKVIPLSLIRR
ncbi:hypothetical protein A3C96_01640 [Candidatus Uhrbacteria bacterium RIFCSPHIGHO2_02_FULL_60_10]|uniref:ABC transporter domain-containing protein n=1 Tax=Candidatus Uhrbacteria bacterium RIFCSPHIGHO2_02_FULL_60_10 TaxID=1802392 RepID=A0A1F7U4L6_9BACT|nr:MAG: hypothetical protein A3C96_01640 [Candidatus Uhrbacteria bacterium RIFCSPHIGHO2_02_FULL_60_10]